MEYHQFVQLLKASENSDGFLANLIKKVGAKYEALYSKENLSNCSNFLASLTGPERGIDAETSSVLINVLPGYLSNFQDSSELTSVKECY
jgi:hypothetical protein